MRYRLNAYFAVLFITIVGSGAALLIVHIATTDISKSVMYRNEANYAALKQSILLNQK